MVINSQVTLPINSFTKMVEIGLNLNMDIYEIRRLNAKALAGSIGGAVEFGEKTGKAQSLVSRWIGETRVPKNIGQVAAREIESAFEKPRGWLDQRNPNLWEKFGLAYSATEQGEPSLDDVRGLSWESIHIARLIERAPRENVQAILTLLGAKEEVLRQTVQSSRRRPNRRSGEDRRQNVEHVDFERRSGLDRRGSRPFFDDEHPHKKGKRRQKKEEEKS